MKKIIIISYFFPPANYAGSYRTDSWAKYFHKFGYYPVVITRQWNKNQVNAVDKVVDNETKVLKYDSHEVHYVQVQNNLREKLIYKFPGLYNITKPLVLLELLFQNFAWLFHPNAYLYRYTQRYLKKHNDISWIIISGNPFDLFKAGYDLSRKFGIKWIADYRDGWTFWNDLKTGLLNKLIRKIDRPFEKKWLSNAAFFTTVNDELVEGISALTGKKGYKIMNGFNPGDYAVSTADTKISIDIDKEALKLVYNGTLYETQDLQVFFDGIRAYLKNSADGKLQIFFPGLLNTPAQYERVKLFAGKDLLPYIVFTHRLPKAEIIALQKASDVMLFFTHTGGLKGTFPSKMFEYFGINKPILTCPNDNGSVDQLISLTRTGYTAKNADEVAGFLQKIRKGDYIFDPSQTEISNFTREKQCQKMAELMDQYSDK